MGVVTQLGAPELAVDRRRMGLEVVIVLGLSLGQSAVYSVLRIIERLTRNVPLAEQTSTLNASITPDRPWLDLTYQIVGITIGLMPVLLALYLLNLTDPPAGGGPSASTYAGLGSTSASESSSLSSSAYPGLVSTPSPVHSV